MELYDIIESINRLTRTKNGQYVLHRSVEQQKIKAFKKISYTLYLVEDNNKEAVLTHQRIIKVPASDIDKAWQIEDLNFLTSLLIWFKNEHFDELISDLDF